MSKEDKMLEELKKIRELLTPLPSPPQEKGLWNELMDFVSRYKVMGFAVVFIANAAQSRFRFSEGEN